jgi:hypothetical protein
MRTPRLRWFCARAADGFAPKLAFLAAILATLVAGIAAIVGRVVSGPRGDLEQIVPVLGTGLRWSVALPLAWSALGAIESDRKAGLLDLAHRHGVSVERWIFGRAVGAGALVALAVGGPMIAVSILLAGLGGGLEGMLARLSLVVPSSVIGIASALVFGVGPVVIGALVPSRPVAVAAIVGAASFGSLVDLAVPGLVGVAAHQVVSPLLAIEDLQALVFAVPRSVTRGSAAALVIVLLPLLGLRAAAHTLRPSTPDGDVLRPSTPDGDVRRAAS